MPLARRIILRDVMALAWVKLRWEHAQRRDFTMSAALKHAWAWVKGAAERVAAETAWAGAPKQVTHLRSILRSPIDRACSARRYGGAEAYAAAYTTSRIGC
jgi:hypothetical protein